MTDRERRIRDEAYSIWNEAGRPDGAEREHWLEAERRLARDGDAASSPADAPKEKAATKRGPRAPVVKNAGNSGASGVKPSAAKSVKGGAVEVAPERPRRTPPKR